MRKKLWAILSSLLFIISLIFLYNCRPALYISPYPSGLNFAFTITDDPDGTKLQKVKPIYSYLDSLGFRTTIACWVYRPRELENMPDPDEQMESETLENGEYLKFLKEYQSKGFEIALHTVTSGHDKRVVTVTGYERFKEVFGSYPEINIMHSKNKENIYWGKNTFRNPAMKMLVGLYDKTPFSGEDPPSQYFWGDICKEKTKYVRLWGTQGINTLKFNPSMPYHDSKKPYVNYWFSFSDGYTAKYFIKLLSKRNVEKLVRERGASIVYTHFAASFCHKQTDGRYILNNEVQERLLYLVRQKEGWFVAASELLERLGAIKNISLTHKGKMANITNYNSYTVKGLTLICRPLTRYITMASGMESKANSEGEIVLGDLAAGETKSILLEGDFRIVKIPETPGFFEALNLAWQRIKIMIFSHRG